MNAFSNQPAFSGPGDQPVLDFLGSPQRILVNGEQSGGEFALLLASGEHGDTAPRHRHRDATETFIVLEGEILIEAGNKRHFAAAGHVAVLPREQVHTFIVVSATARYLTLHTPAGFEAFVRAVSEASTTGGVPPAALTALAADHGIDILGPGLELPPGHAAGKAVPELLPLNMSCTCGHQGMPRQR
jgi:quercetin dioxygenase-like cupin family protein